MADQRIIDRVRKLMALANDGAASEGEIANAMAFAAKLMDEHHIAEQDINLTTRSDNEPITFGTADGITTRDGLSTWESALGHAICKLFGSVNWYRTHERHTIRVNGIAQTTRGGNVKQGLRVVFYGPTDEAAEAAELFSEWARLIATMGVMKFGACYKGDGGAYCYGFATALSAAANRIATERKLVEAKPLRLLGVPGEVAESAPGVALTVANRHEMIRTEAKTWLAKVKGINLGTSRRASGYSGTGGSAYSQGCRDGSSAGFGRRGKSAGYLTA